MKKKKYPILEFDTSSKAIFDPRTIIKPIGISRHCVLCYFQDVLTKLIEENKLEVVTYLKSEMGKHPVYKVEFYGSRIIIFQPGLGAPMAAGFLEELIALGCNKFIVCGGAGVLEKNIIANKIIIPCSAIRDEGTSYHYLGPGREVKASAQAIKALKKTLNKYNINYLLSKTWTTDAFYRETLDKIQLRKREGCLTVEMEAAAFFAVAKFRGVILAQLLYGGDDLSGITWNHRNWDKDATTREKLFWLSVEACLNI